jgi:hypothetical protein
MKTKSRLIRIRTISRDDKGRPRLVKFERVDYDIKKRRFVRVK